MLSLCAACGRHVKDSTCPFCGGTAEAIDARRTARAARILMLAGLAVGASACGFANGYGGPPPESPRSTAPADAGAD
ncbi:MAG TPA: hypothetical protein VGH28_15540 [Polyangiaceae bacterium]